MADEEILDTEEIDVEPNIDQEEEEGFDSYIDGTAGKDDDDKDGDAGDDKAGEEDDKAGKDGEDGSGKDGDGEEKDKEGGEEDDKKKDEDEDTAEKRALKRAERFKDEDDKGGEEDDKDKDKGGKDKDAEEDKGKKTSITKEQVKAYLDIISDDDLPGEIIIGDETINFDDMKENFPDDFNAIKVLSGMMATKVATQLIENAGYVKAADVEEKMESLSDRITMLGFWDAVRDVHTDGKAIARSPEFKEWIEKQPKRIQALSANWDAEDAIAVIDFFKEAQAKKKVKDHDDKQRNNKKKKDGLHSSGMRSKPDTKKSESQNDMEDEEAGFNEGLASIGQ